MIYMKQFAIILAITAVGDVLHHLLPFPLPASIYGLLILLGMLLTGDLKLEQVEKTGLFLVEIMPFMFIPASVGLISSWDSLKPLLLPFVVIISLTTFSVMVVSGKVTDILLKRGEDRGRD